MHANIFSDKETSNNTNVEHNIDTIIENYPLQYSHGNKTENADGLYWYYPECIEFSFISASGLGWFIQVPGLARVVAIGGMFVIGATVGVLSAYLIQVQ